MPTFEVKDMRNGECVSAITEAVKAVDKHAEVKVDLTTNRVSIDQTHADPAILINAMQAAGYTTLGVYADAAGSPAGIPIPHGDGSFSA